MYDIRGIVSQTLTPQIVFLIGKIFGRKLVDSQNYHCLVARDARESGLDLTRALIMGLNSSGVNVKNIGMVPTPVLYFATHYSDTSSGIILTGSHNPPEYNGLKLVLNKSPFWGEQIQNLYRDILSVSGLSDKYSDGSVVESPEDESLTSSYVDYVKKNIVLSRPLKIAVDAGNGIAGPIATEIYEALGCNVKKLFCEPKGDFPNHHPDPAEPKNLSDLIKTVRNENLDVGIAFDGDGDRLGLVSSSGKIIWPDQQMMLFSGEVLKKLPGAKIIFDVKCSRHLGQWISKLGGKPLMWKTGHSHMKTKLKEVEACLAGEMSGHIFFNDEWFGFDDAIYAGARLLRILSRESDPTKILESLPESISTPELKAELGALNPDHIIRKLSSNSIFKEAKTKIYIDGVRVEYEDGFGLVRPSNTTPMLVFRFEADNMEAMNRIQNEFRFEIYRITKNLQLPF
tara:strand:- start:35760 stop:37127 length:1368 start_codon:yes stop_codon:yes gene_type:complete